MKVGLSGYLLVQRSDYEKMVSRVVFTMLEKDGFKVSIVHPEQPASPLDSQCLSPGTPLQRLQDLRS